MTSPQPTNPADVLRRAADHLATHGWIRDRFCANPTDTTPASVIGAIALVAGQPIHGVPTLDDRIPRVDDPLIWDTIRNLSTHLHRTRKVSGIATWEAHPSQTGDRIVSTLRRIAVIWDREQPDPDAWPQRWTSVYARLTAAQRTRITRANRSTR